MSDSESEHNHSEPQCTSALSHAYKDRLKPCLDAIDFLRANGMQHEVPLPAIAVVGDQSVGKSSVLESISGIEFPRGSGIVTRCPLQLSMRYRDDTDWCGSVRYTNRNGTPVEKPINSPKVIGDIIRTAQNEIAGSKGEISESLIDMHVESADVPDLTLIDLPGIARYSSELGGQVAELTKKLIYSYIERREVLILVVIPCHVDIETVEAISLAKEVDPQSRRTIGVLTCPDLVNPGSEMDVLRLMQNKKIPLKKGYVTLRCRSQQQLKDSMSLKEAYEEEEKFFRRHPQFRQLMDHQRGSKTLATKLSDELFAAIKENVPAMIREVQECKDRYGQQLQEIGEGPPSDESGKKEVLASMFRRFCEEFRVVSLGIHRHETNRLYSRFRTHAQQFAKEVHECLRVDTATGKAMWDDVRRRVEDQRGRELPGFDNVFPVVESMVKEHFIAMVRSPCSQLSLVTNHEVDETLRAIADRHFVDFPLLNQRVKEISERIRSELVERTKQSVEMVLKQEELIFTQDYLYCQEHERMSRPAVRGGEKEKPKKEKRDGEKRDGERRDGERRDGERKDGERRDGERRDGERKDGERKDGERRDGEKREGERRDGEKRELDKKESERAADEREDRMEGEGDVTTFMEGNLDVNTRRVIRGVECYIRIAVRRLVDFVPMVVMYHMLNDMSEQLSNKLTVMLTEPETLYHMLEQEDHTIAAQRVFLKERIQKLREAEAQLARI